MSVSRGAAFVLAALLLGSSARSQDIGIEGPSYSGANSFPSGTKPESKLWFHDGAWWGCLWSAAAQSYAIHRLDPATQVWSDTGVAIDARPVSRADCLWNGTKLYVSSHRFTPGEGNSGHPLVVYRYAYDPVAERYSLDPGFPVQIADSSTETTVIDQDSTGTLWAVWLRDLRLYFAHTLGGDDRAWSAPAIHPRNTSAVSDDDVASVVHFGGDRIGVMWSDQVTFDYWFSVHVDGDPVDAWSEPEHVLAGIGDDHINLKAAGDGRVFAALKTSTDEVHLAVRATDGTWTTHLVGELADGWTRAICVLDEQADRVHLFATSPILAGTIYEKVSSMDAISFEPGIGTPVILDAKHPAHNDTTSTKQNVSGASGIVALSCHQPSERYWHHRDDLGGAAAAAPVASATADPRSGFAALEVRFQDSSSSAPTSWFWTFGDGASSTEQHPVHVYAAAGTYAVTLTVANALGQDALELLDWITVASMPDVLTLQALQDAQVREASPDNTYGALPEMRVRQEDPNADYRALVSFLVPPSSRAIASAHLRLFSNNGSPDGGTVYALGAGWQEPFVTWSSAPSIAGTPVGSLGPVATGAWVELDVSAAVTGSGLVAFGIANASANSVFYSTREGAHPAELELTFAAIVHPPVAAFTSDVTGGAVPLSVQFTDTSSNAPTSWSWDFGDGATSSEQHPAHVYALVGTYTVSLTAANAGGSDVETLVGHVTVLPPAPVASFTSDLTGGTVPLSVQFTDTSSNAPTSWSWDFGDGATSSEQHPAHVYALVGTYTVSLTAANAGGSDVETLVGHVTVLPPVPVASFHASATQGKAPLSVQFIDTSLNEPTSWTWDFGDGATSTAQHPSHVFETAGDYLVRLTVVNASGSDEATIEVRVRRPKVQPWRFEPKQRQRELLQQALVLRLVRLGR